MGKTQLTTVCCDATLNFQTTMAQFKGHFLFYKSENFSKNGKSCENFAETQKVMQSYRQMVVWLIKEA